MARQLEITQEPRTKIGRYAYNRKESSFGVDHYYFNKDIGFKMLQQISSSNPPLRSDRALLNIYFNSPLCDSDNKLIGIYQVKDCAARITVDEKDSSLVIFNKDPAKREETLKALEEIFK